MRLCFQMITVSNNISVQYSSEKKNLNRYNDTRWLSRAKACDDIVKLFNLMKHFESTMNNLKNIRNEENTIKFLNMDVQ